MRNRLLMLLIIGLGALIQMLLPAFPMFGGMKPPILAAMVLHYALRRNNRDMWIAIAAATLMQDGLEPGSFGPALLAFPTIGLLAHRIRSEIFSDGIVTQLFLGAVIGVFCTFITMLIFAASGQRPFHFGGTLHKLIGSFALGMFTLPLVSRSIMRIEALLPKRRDYGWQ
jgi:rod shape-determining protein MreD